MKKFLFIVFLFISTSLFAFNAGEKIIYPSFGMGFSGGSVTAWDGASLGAAAGDATLVNDADTKLKFAYSIGAGFDYFFINNLAITSGIYYEKTPFEIKYPKRTAITDLTFNYDFAFLTIPVGVRYYKSIFLLGGGFYYEAVLSDDATISGVSNIDVKTDTNKNNFGFFIDLGVNFNLFQNNTLLGFVRFKKGITDVYDEEDIITNLKMTSLIFNIAYGIRF